VSRRRRSQGFSLVALVVTMAVMMIFMTVGTSGWSYVMKNEREEEAIFRGEEVVVAIQRFQRKSGNGMPATLDILVEKHFLRKHALKDPLSKDGKWKIIHQGDLIALGTPGQPTSKDALGRAPAAQPSPSATPFFGLKGEVVGPIVGVATKVRGKSLRLFNGQQDYAVWMFTINQPKPIIGEMPFMLAKGAFPGQGLPGEKVPGQEAPGAPKAPAFPQ
jgi:type II secretory pathway pseudopilin PulG